MPDDEPTIITLVEKLVAGDELDLSQSGEAHGRVDATWIRDIILNIKDAEEALKDKDPPDPRGIRIRGATIFGDRPAGPDPKSRDICIGT